MDFLKKLVGVAAFVVALGLAILLTKYYGARPTPPTPPPPPKIVNAPPPPPPALETGAHGVTWKASLISLDFAAKKTYTTLVIEGEPGQSAPEKVWVWTYFFTPDDGGRKSWWGEPVEISKPFAGGNRASVTANAVCEWCDAPDAPKSGIYARVNVSTVSKEAARLRTEQLDFNIVTATPVVIQHAQKRAK